MTDYKNLGGDSNVLGFDLLPNAIVVKFKTKNKDGCDTYLYSFSSAGQLNIEQMKKLAENGQGLNSFINRNVKKLYENKW